MKNIIKNKLTIFLSLILAIAMLLSGCSLLQGNKPPISLDNIPAFDGKNAYVEINGNKPFFDGSEETDKAYESYSPLDKLGRCGVAIACITKELMPTDERESIGSVKPSGWQSVKYDIIEGKYLYNRAHLIGFQLTGENANKENLITGTRYLNIEGMLDFENMVADYIKEINGKVLYRVTPIFEGSEPVARGVLMEAMSIGNAPEENGEDILFCIYAYNVQPGIEIDYMTGESRLAGSGEKAETNESAKYILNTSSNKIHTPDCSGIKNILNKNKQETDLTLEELLEMGYTKCGICKPE